MGGTFDPIHHGHLVAASEVQSWFDLDEVVFVPAGEPWQKSDRQVSAGRAPLPHDRRRDRVQPALRGQPGRHRPCRPHLHDRHPARAAGGHAGRRPLLHHRCRRDGRRSSRWRDPEELFGLAHFVGCTRPGHELAADTLEGLPGERITLVEIPALAISSTECRDRVERGEPVWYLVPDGVVQYIGKHRLYAPTPPRSTASDRRRARPRAHPRRRRRGGRQARQDLLAFDVSEQLVITDVFLLCSAPTPGRCDAVVDAVEERLLELDAKPVRREGEREGRWVLLDFCDLVVHVQHADERAFYALERLWRDCPTLDLPPPESRRAG